MSSSRTLKVVLCAITVGYMSGGGRWGTKPALADGPGATGPAISCIEVSCGNEPSIAIDPLSRGHLAIGHRKLDCVSDELSTAGAGWAYSGNGGAIWYQAEFPLHADRSDPVLDGSRTRGGVIYYLSIETNLSCLNCFDLYRSTDGGLSWGDGSPVLHTCGGDKPWMVIDKIGCTGCTGCGNIYIYWTIPGCEDGLRFLRIVDDGNTLTPLHIALPGPVEFGTMAVGPDGELYIAGDDGIGPDGTNIVVLKSTDVQDPTVTNPCFTYQTLPRCGGTLGPRGDGCPSSPNPTCLIAQTWIACDTSSGPTRGNVYVLRSMRPPAGTADPGCSEATDDCGIQTQSRNWDPMDVWFWRSTDGGLNWEGPKRINDDPCRAKAWQWFGTMSIAPDGRLDAIWCDNRQFRDESQFEIKKSQLYYSNSSDGGQTWSVNQAISGPWVNSCSGVRDYYQMISDDAGAHLAWAAIGGTPNTSRVYYTRISDFTTDPRAASGCP